MKWKNDFVGHRVEKKYGKIGIVEYTESSYTGEIKDKKLITKYCFFFVEVLSFDIVSNIV